MRLFLTTWVMLAVVALAEVDPITEYIASLPWHGHYATQPEENDIPDFIITIAYNKKDVVSDKDIFPFKLYPRKGTYELALFARPGSCRDIFGPQRKWCNGGANVNVVKQESFEIDLSLTWGGPNLPTEFFRQSFNCVWKTKQDFETNGFHIVVETTKYNAEQTNSPYSSPATGSKR